jgi:hypothetical protein
VKRVTRETWVALAVLGLLLLAIIATTVWQTNQETPLPTLATFSTQPAGGQAFHTWLDQLGYEVGTKMPGRFQPPATADLLFIMEPTINITSAEWETLDEWVDEGGTLILVGDSFNTLFAFEHYEVSRFSVMDTNAFVEPAPSLASPPLNNTLSNTSPQAVLDHRREAVEELAFVPQGPVLLTFPQGSGRVVLSTLTYPLTNAGLKETGNPEWALNIASFAPPGGTIWFDEWHHGVRGGGADRGLAHWLRNAPAGNALIYAALVTFITLVLSGRRFGRPVPLPQETARRAPVEHINAVANLSRRAGHRRPVLQAYHHRLKRELGQRYRLDPGLPDEEYVRQLAAYDPHLNSKQLTILLAQLSRPDVSETRLLELAQQVEAWLTGR